MRPLNRQFCQRTGETSSPFYGEPSGNPLTTLKSKAAGSSDQTPEEGGGAASTTSGGWATIPMSHSPPSPPIGSSRTLHSPALGCPCFPPSSCIKMATSLATFASPSLLSALPSLWSWGAVMIDGSHPWVQWGLCMCHIWNIHVPHMAHTLTPYNSLIMKWTCTQHNRLLSCMKWNMALISDMYKIEQLVWLLSYICYIYIN